LFKSYRKLGGKEYEEEYSSRIVKEIETQRQYFEQLNNGNLQIEGVKQKMREELTKFEREREQNERKFQEIKDENSAEKALLLSILEENKRNMESMKEGYSAEVEFLKNEMESTRRELNQARSQSGGK